MFKSSLGVLSSNAGWRQFRTSVVHRLCSKLSQQMRIYIEYSLSCWRQDRDLNSRVQGTVDFESTAIPSYAILASMCPLLRDGHKDDALSNRYAGAVKRT